MVIVVTCKLATLSGNPLKLYIGFRKDPIGFLMDTQPLGDVVKIPSVSGQPSYILHHPEWVREVLAISEQSVVKGKSGRILGLTLGRGLLTSEGEQHAQQRRIMQPAFHTRMLAAAADDIVRLTEERIATWPEDQWFPVSQQFLELTLDIVFQTLFGVEVGEDRENLHDIIEHSVQFSAHKLLSAVTFPLWLPLPANRKHKRLVDKFDAVISRVMQQGRERVARLADDEYTRTAHGTPTMLSGRTLNVLDYLYTVRTEAQDSIPDDEIRDQLATLIIGGHETTANLLSFVLYRLALDKRVTDKLYDELDHELGGRRPGFEDVRKLVYMRQVLQETMRLYPPAWTILRETVEPITVLGVTVPAGSSLIISPYVMHRNPAWYDDPEQFIPERFADDQPHTWPQFAYIPFGGGSRTCIGNTFAKMEATLILAVILQKRHVQLQKDVAVDPEPSVSLRVRGGLTMKMTVRNELK